MFATALVQEGDLNGAIAELEPSEVNSRKFKFFVAGGNPWQTAARMYLAELYQQSSRIEDARRVVGELSSLLMYADSDDPVAIRLKKLKVKLAGGGARAQAR